MEKINLIMYVVLVWLIIDRRKIKRQSLKHKEKYDRMKLVIDSLSNIICLKNPDGKWIEANDKILKIFNKESFIGLDDNDLISEYPEHENALKECMKSDYEAWCRKEPVIGEETFKINNTYQTFEVEKRPLFNENGEKKGLIVIGRDITERRLAETFKKEAEENKKQVKELDDYNKIQMEFFANISHEFRTPLNLILSSLKLLEMKEVNRRDLKDNTEQYTKIIRQNSYRLLRLVNNIIDISKIEGGFLDAKMENLDIVKLIEDTTLSTLIYASECGLELIFDTDIEEKIIACDRDRIERLILNLISNSVKFTERGGKILVELKCINDVIELSVSDTGCGIPIEEQSRIFKRFSQVDKSLNRVREGSGIGLCLVKSIIEMHYGNIRIDNTYKSGTKFVIEIPCRTVHDEIYSSKEEGRLDLIDIEFSDVYI